MIKYKLGVMSSTWTVEAESADVAVAASLMIIGDFMPVAIYEPEGVKSKFSHVNTERQAEELAKFAAENSKKIIEAKKTYKNLT